MIKLRGVNSNADEFSSLIEASELPYVFQKLCGAADNDLIEVYGNYTVTAGLGILQVEVVDIQFDVNGVPLDIMGLIDTVDLEEKLAHMIDSETLLDLEYWASYESMD